MANRRGYEELPDKENADFNGTYQPRFVAKASTFDLVSQVLTMEEWEDNDALLQRLREVATGSIGKQLLSNYIQRTPGIKGEGRKDLKEAIIGAPQDRPALSVSVGSEREAEPQKPKRGL